MEITKHNVDMMAAPAKDIADHIRDIETIIHARKLSTVGVFELERYKEAVIDLFINECKRILISQKTPSEAQSQQAQKDEVQS